jgi:hypothetical protein
MYRDILSNARRQQRRPTDSWINRNLEATSTMPHQAPLAPFRRIGTVCLDVDDPPAPCSPFTAPLPLLVAVSIAASGCRFWLPFCRLKYFNAILLSGKNELRDWGTKFLNS